MVILTFSLGRVWSGTGSREYSSSWPWLAITNRESVGFFTDLKYEEKSSVVDPNTLNLDPDPEFWPNLDPDPEFLTKRK